MPVRPATMVYDFTNGAAGSLLVPMRHRIHSPSHNVSIVTDTLNAHRPRAACINRGGAATPPPTVWVHCGALARPNANNTPTTAVCTQELCTKAEQPAEETASLLRALAAVVTEFNPATASGSGLSWASHDRCREQFEEQLLESVFRCAASAAMAAPLDGAPPQHTSGPPPAPHRRCSGPLCI